MLPSSAVTVIAIGFSPWSRLTDASSRPAPSSVPATLTVAAKWRACAATVTSVTPEPACARITAASTASAGCSASAAPSLPVSVSAPSRASADAPGTPLAAGDHAPTPTRLAAATRTW